MLTEIYSNKYMVGSGKGFVPHFTGVEVTGTLRNSSGYLEVYTGQHWQAIGGGGNVELTQVAQAALEWAIKAKQKEEELDKMMDKYPALKNAKDSFDTVRVLCECEERLEQQKTP